MIDYSVILMYTTVMNKIIKEFGTLGQRIKEVRQALKLTAKDLASKVGIHPTYITYIEKHGKIPSPAVLKKIKVVLNDPILDDIYLVTRYPEVCEKYQNEQRNINDEFLEKAQALLLNKNAGPEKKKEVKKWIKESQAKLRELTIEFQTTIKKLGDMEKSI